MGGGNRRRGGGLLVQPWQDMRAGVFQGPGEARGKAHLGPAPAAAMCDAGGEGAPGRPLGLGVCGVVRGLAGGAGRAIPRPGAGMEGTEHEAVSVAPGRAEGALVAGEAEGNRWSVAALAPGGRPRVDGVWRVGKDAAGAVLRARGVPAAIVCGSGPVDADDGRKLLRRETRQGSPPVGDARGGSRDRHAGVRRRHAREPVARPTRRVRDRTQAHPQMRGDVRKHPGLRRGDSSSANACSGFPGQRPARGVPDTESRTVYL
jgi:hypothetical protein